MYASPCTLSRFSVSPSICNRTSHKLFASSSFADLIMQLKFRKWISIGFIFISNSSSSVHHFFAYSLISTKKNVNPSWINALIFFILKLILVEYRPAKVFDKSRTQNPSSPRIGSLICLDMYFLHLVIQKRKENMSAQFSFLNS